MPRKSSNPKSTKVKKTRKKNIFVQIIKNLVEVPASAPTFFWAKESKLAKSLVEQCGEEKVLAYTPREKYPSLAYFIAIGEYKDLIERNWALKNFKIPERKTFEIGEKIGPDVGIKPKKDTIRSWLDQKNPKGMKQTTKNKNN